MGLAASQARLLTITARLADNELRSQTINNAKMRLATQSSQASEDYVNALNNARLMFTNIDANGLSQTQVLNFNNLTAYSQYNNQYGLVNSAGLALVSEKEAKLFAESNGDINKYLEAHDLEWETTYFNYKQDEYGNELNDIQAKMTSFLGTDYSVNKSGQTLYDLGYLFLDVDGRTLDVEANNADFKTLYEKYDANNLSIEKANYEGMAKEYYQELVKLYKVASKMFREDVLGANKTEQDIIDSIYDKAGGDLAKVKQELENRTYGSDLQMSLAEIEAKGYLTEEGLTELRRYLNSATTTPSGYGSGFAYESSIYEIAKSQAVNESGVTTTTWRFGDIVVSSDNVSNSSSYGNFKVGLYISEEDKAEGKTPKYDYRINGTLITEEGIEVNSTTLQNLINSIEYISNSTEITDEKDKAQGYLKYNSSTETILNDDGTTDVITTEFAINMFAGSQNISSQDAFRVFLKQYFAKMLGTQGYFNTIDYALDNLNNSALAEFKEIHEKFKTIYGIDVSQDFSLLLDFEKLMQSKGKGIDPTTYNPDDASTASWTEDELYGWLGTSAFQNVVDAYKTDLMVNILGEPKYTWVDASDKTNTGNAEAKAQWYTNLFNRMQKGFKVLEDGLASSSKWLEYAFESGLVGLEQVDKSYNWNALTYSTCSNITEETDSSEAVAIAEAKYKRAMNDIEQKDKMYDLQLKNIDTEHNSLQTEYDSIKTVISKNIERTMKFDQSA